MTTWSMATYQQKTAGTKAAGSIDTEREHPHFNRAIEEKTADSHLEWLSQFAKGLELLDCYDNEELDAKGLSI